MKRICFLCCFVILLIFPGILYGQTKISVTKPHLKASNENLIIEYDILNTEPSDFFMVWIEVTDASGNKINAVSVSGDVGQDIKGGNNKRIIWNLGKDNIYIDEEIFVEVKAEKITVHEKIADTKTSEETKIVKKDESSMERKTISKGNMIVSSVVFPGWGQSKAKKGKPYWLLGVAGYGCLAGSVYLNRQASSAYHDYKLSMDINEFNSLYDKAVQCDKFSKYMAYSGIGIWVADLIWVLATPVKSPNSVLYQNDKKLKIMPYFDTRSNITMVSLTYKF